MGYWSVCDVVVIGILYLYFGEVLWVYVVLKDEVLIIDFVECELINFVKECKVKYK